MSSNTDKFFIANVSLEQLDKHGIESSFLVNTSVPVTAKNEDQASKKAVVWQSDGGTAQENDQLITECREVERSLVWKVTKCLHVTKEEMDIFLSLTQGVSTAIICK
jgi:hypothetical protein